MIDTNRLGDFVQLINISGKEGDSHIIVMHSFPAQHVITKYKEKKKVKKRRK